MLSWKTKERINEIFMTIPGLIALVGAILSCAAWAIKSLIAGEIFWVIIAVLVTVFFVAGLVVFSKYVIDEYCVGPY
jgi:uncharacterized membrane protein